MMTISFVDLKRQYDKYKTELDQAIDTCIANNWFIGGEDHIAFEKEFSTYCGGGYTALCGNGTDALYLTILEILGSGDGLGEIVTVSNTFIATSEAITKAGYRPVFVDINPKTYLIDTDKLIDAFNKNTKAIIPVHLYGQMAPMNSIMEIAREFGLFVIEDAAQAHGSSWEGFGPGYWGDAACFSFYPSKNLGAWGDGGAVFSKNKDLINRIKKRLNHGRSEKYLHELEGENSRLDGIQAAILRVKLRHLDEWNQTRRLIAREYSRLFEPFPDIVQPYVMENARHVFHLYVVQVSHRDIVLLELKRRGIEVGIHYPIPLHEQPAYSHLNISPTTLINTHRISRRILSLPIYPEIESEEINYVAKHLVEVVRNLD